MTDKNKGMNANPEAVSVHNLCVFLIGIAKKETKDCMKFLSSFLASIYLDGRFNSNVETFLELCNKEIERSINFLKDPDLDVLGDVNTIIDTHVTAFNIQSHLLREELQPYSDSDELKALFSARLIESKMSFLAGCMSVATILFVDGKEMDEFMGSLKASLEDANLALLSTFNMDEGAGMVIH